MKLRTEINPRFLMRMGLVGLFCIGMTLYCIYDGTVTYPAQIEQSQAYLEFKEEHSDLGEQDLFDEWKAFAAEKGWDPGIAGKEQTPYGKPKTQIDINGQFYMGGFTGLLGLFFLGRVLLNSGCWVEADDDSLRTSEKREAKFDQVIALDKKKWQNKGIAKVIYEVDGQKNKIVLDDCNYVRETTDQILRHVEAKIGFNKIINGKAEPPPKPDAETKPAAANS